MPEPCWKILKCGREVGGAHVVDQGVCPANKLNAGDACWLIAGTFCGGEVQGSHAQKQNACMLCEVYRAYDLQHKGNMRKKWADHLK